jgi:antirestriction protein ArdC
MAEIYETITNHIIAALDAGRIPWRKEWKSSTGKLTALPTNYSTKTPYRGVNILTLLCSGYESNYWITYKQAQSMGLQVRRGEKSSPIVKWHFDKKADKKTGEEKSFAWGKVYHVFNLEQVDGVPVDLPFEDTSEPFQPIAVAESIAAKYLAVGPTLSHGGSRAYYQPLSDSVRMPEPSAFDTPEAYYSTLFHELAHSTGHKTRLNRSELVTLAAFGDESYSKEELTAEFTTAFLCAESGCSNESVLTNQTAYIQGWLRSLKNDKTLAIQAAQRAQKAADYVLRREYQPAAPSASGEVSE